MRNRDRVENRDIIDGLINQTLAGDNADAWLAKLKAAGIPSGRINTVAQALDDPHTAARHMIETVNHPKIGELRMLGIPFRFGETPASVRARRRCWASTPTKFSAASLAWTRAQSLRCATSAWYRIADMKIKSIEPIAVSLPMKKPVEDGRRGSRHAPTTCWCASNPTTVLSAGARPLRRRP